jgi:hypothetical protein
MTGGKIYNQLHLSRRQRVFDHDRSVRLSAPRSIKRGFEVAPETTAIQARGARWVIVGLVGVAGLASVLVARLMP